VSYDGCPPRSRRDGIYFGYDADGPVVWTLSEPWYGYTWWPNKDDNDDKRTADLFFTVPSAMTVASNGTLVETTDVTDGSAGTTGPPRTRPRRT